MPRCYLVIVCSASSLDVDSNNLSLFNLVERVQFRAGALAQLIMPLEVHACWSFSGDERDRDYEARWVVCGADGVEVVGKTFPLRTATPRFRMRMFGIGIPSVSGECAVRTEWRALEGGWTREPVTWPLALASID